MSEDLTTSGNAGSGSGPSIPGRPRISRRARILLALVIVFITALFIEGVLQLWYRATVGKWLSEWWAIPIYAQDPHRVYKLKPNLDYIHKTREFTARYQTDAMGLRTDGQRPLPTVPKPNDCFRILALGPSFAFGWGVNYEDAYMPRIARQLQVPGKRVELINLGTPSQPICYQLKWLRETGFVYQPDLIVQTIYGEGDDFGSVDTDDRLPDETACVRNGYLYQAKEMTLSMRLRSLRRYSALLFYGWHAYQRITGTKAVKGDGKEFYSKPPPDGLTLTDTVKRLQSFTQFVQAAVTNKPQVAFLFVPSSWVVRPGDIARVSHHGRKPNPTDIRKQLALISSVLNSNHVDFIDTTPALVQFDAKGRTYYLYDIHFTVLGTEQQPTMRCLSSRKWFGAQVSQAGKHQGSLMKMVEEHRNGWNPPSKEFARYVPTELFLRRSMGADCRLFTRR